MSNHLRRIRALKSRLGKAYPEAFRVCSDVYNMDDLLEEDEEEENESSRSSLQSGGKGDSGMFIVNVFSTLAKEQI